VLLDNCKGTLVHTTQGKLVVASGLENMIVICEEDVVLIFPKEKEQQVKAYRDKLKLQGKEEYL
jgi:mannose-1-phosphate guanylyltransferase